MHASAQFLLRSPYTGEGDTCVTYVMCVWMLAGALSSRLAAVVNSTKVLGKTVSTLVVVFPCFNND